MSAPPLSSRLVNVAEDAELRLVMLLAEHSPSLDVRQCETNIDSGEASALLKTILADKGSVPALVTHVTDVEEATGSFALLVALIGSPSSETSAIVSGLGKTIVEAGDASEASCSRKLRLLAVLFNLRETVLEKVEVLRLMITVAGNFPSSFLRAQDPLGNMLLAENEEEDISEKGGSADHLALTPSVPRIVQLLDSWEIDAEKRFALYQAIVSAFKDSAPVRKQRFQLLSVECSSSNKGTVAAVAKEAAIGAIRDPISLFSHQRNILNLAPIGALAKSEPVLFELLKIFQEGKLSDYEAFLKAKGGEKGVLGKWNLDADKCRQNMRILSLCSLASEHEEIPYESIAETLKIDSSNTREVEAQVISAVNSGLLQAKIDQLSKKVLVERCVVRKFDTPQWKMLQERLKAWKLNVGSILSALDEAQASASSATAAP